MIGFCCHKVANDPAMLALLFVVVFCGGWGIIFTARAVYRLFYDG